MNAVAPTSIRKIAAAFLIALAAGACSPEEEPVARRMAGDVEEVLGATAPEDLPAQARGLLETDRPWRASRLMERYLEATPDAPPEDLVLAARAEGGWGSWEEVLALLDTVPALESHADGIGLYLLGRGRDEAGDTDGAVEAYRAFLAFSPPQGELEPERGAARLRLALALIQSGQGAAGEEALAGLEVSSRWFDVLRADALALRGDTAAVRQAVAGLDSGILGLRGWRARVTAAERAGDLAEARALANRARAWARTSTTEAEFLLTAGRIAVAMGDTAAGRDAFRSVIASGAGSARARRAAALLLEDEMTPDDHLAVARVQVAQGLQEEAIEGFERWLGSGRGSSSEREEVHLEHATALFYAERYRQAIQALEPIEGRLSARMLRARAEAHRGHTDEAARLYLDIAGDRAGSTAANARFIAAGTYHDAGETEKARDLYRDVVRRYPGSDRMGHALMRLAGIAFEEEDYTEAARIWDQYRKRYPNGDRAIQATYWAGRAREERGDSADAAALFRAVRESDRNSYYALMASRRLGEPFWPLPMSPSPAADAEADRRVGVWIRELDLLRSAGFDAAAAAMADDLVGEVGGDRATRYALAEALADRGYSRGAIRLGNSLQTAGPPDRRLLQILYPFPYRTLITEEARDRGLDPFIAAALIRQESMFEALITSPAGARGLMQIMPATGARLAEAAGMERWNAELLYHPEINVHLGIRYVAQHMENYDGSLPSVFSAYNAGSHRVEWWSEFPEYGDDELFTERIPYRETRNYVKILTRNRALYDGLYSGSVEPTS